MDNSFLLLPDGSTEPGIAHELADDSRGSMQIGSPDKGERIAFYHHPVYGPPICRNGRVFEASPMDNRKRKYLMGRSFWKGALLRISTTVLAFTPSRSGHFDAISNVYRGAETIAPAFVQIGWRTDADQEQLVALEDGEAIFIADQGARYIRYVCRLGRLQPSVPGKDSLARFLAVRAKEKVYTHEGLKWTWHTLKGLNALQFWTGDLDHRLWELEKMSDPRRRRK